MMMLPASTSSPPNFLTPRRFACESRPFRVLPPAFLCAMSVDLLKLTLRDDLRDLHVGVRLAVRAFALVVLAAAELDDAHLVALAMALDGGDDLRRSDVGRADGHRGARTHEENAVEFDARALLGVELFDAHHGAFLNAVLLTARGNHGIHNVSSESRPMGPQKSRGL